MPEPRSYLQLRSDASDESGDAPHSVRQFLTLCLLGAREEAGFPSNDAGYDEDVNVYVVGLLERFLSPVYHEQSARYVHAYDQDLAREARRSGDERHNFRLYRANADHLLLNIGVFRRCETLGPNHHPLLQREAQDFSARGGTYYRVASSTLRRLRKCQSAQGTALAKLGDSFEAYVGVLHRLRSSYFHLTERLSDGSMYHLAQDSVFGDPDARKDQLYDQFLDAFSAYRADGNADNRCKLEGIVQELRATDPEFAFQMPD